MRRTTRSFSSARRPWRQPGARFLKGNPPDDKEAFNKAWMAARKKALTAAGMDAIFE